MIKLLTVIAATLVAIASIATGAEAAFNVRLNAPAGFSQLHKTGCGGGGYVEIPIQTPIAPKLDITPFQRIYVAGFLAGANEDLDANMEMVRLLRSQLRNKNILRVVDAATLLHSISHDEMLELAAQGAKVLHDASVEFARRSGIALYARATNKDGGGTRIDQPLERVE